MNNQLNPLFSGICSLRSSETKWYIVETTDNEQLHMLDIFIYKYIDNNVFFVTSESSDLLFYES